MSTSTFLLRVRVIAALLAVLLGGPLGFIASWHDMADDPWCAAPAARGEHDARVGASSGVHDDADHCLVCHWLTGLRAGFVASPLTEGELVVLAAWPDLPETVRPSAFVSGVPSRAPPAFFLA